jgi:translation initiation factor 1 (eIF-1/SUI1)
MLQLKFASSASVQNLPGKNAGKEIVIQGNFVEELQTLFSTEYGIKQEFISVQNKLGKKKKNN